MKKLLLITAVSSVIALGAMNVMAQGKIANNPGEKILFSLDPIPEKDWKKAKTVTSIPIDQLGKLKIRIYSGNKTFKEHYGKFWGNMVNGLDLAAKFIPKGETPDFSDTKKWNTHSIAESKEDSEWPDSNTIDTSMIKVAKGIKLWDVSSDNDIAFEVQFYKLKKTGKTIWVNNGWVDETYWETLGKPSSTGILKIDPPTKENIPPDLTKVKEMALDYANNNKNHMQITGSMKANYSFADYYSLIMLDNKEYPNTREGISMDGSKVTALDVVKGPSYGWNYNESSLEQKIYADYNVNLELHAAKTEMLFMKSEMDCKCKNATLTLEKMLDKPEWTVSHFSIPQTLSNCQKK